MCGASAGRAGWRGWKCGTGEEFQEEAFGCEILRDNKEFVEKDLISEEGIDETCEFDGA